MQNEGSERRPLSANGREMASRLQSIREILTSDRDSGLSADEQRAALDAVDSEIADRLTTEREGTTYDTTLHRLADSGVNDRYNYLLERYGSTSPSSIARSRRRLNRTMPTLQRQTDRIRRLASRSEAQDSSPANLPQTSPVQSSRTRQASDDQDGDMDLHQPNGGKYSRKRRKLDDGTPEQVRVFPEYGVEGTLLPGNLNMLVLDLGDGTSEAYSPTDQIAKVRLPLHDNKDPYRTKRNNCDILMKHSGGHPFALSKLIIRLPTREYDAPPLQGMVFVAMDRQTVLIEASHYNSYFPVSHSHHRRRYDSYRPSVDYMRSARSPHPVPRPRRPSEPFPQETPWYDSRLSLSEPAEVPSRTGIKVSLESVTEPEESPSSGPRSPRPWETTHEYTTRAYIDRYRPSASSRARERSSISALDMASLSPTSSEDEEDEQDQDNSDSVPNYLDVPNPYDMHMLNSRRDLQEAEARQRNILAQMRMQRDQGNGYFRIPAEQHPPPHQAREATNDDGSGQDSQAAEYAAMEATLAQRGFNIEVMRRDNARLMTQTSPRTSPPSHPSTKRLPGCTGMLQGHGPHSPSDCDVVAPHATFSVARENGGGVAVNFVPEV